MKLPYAGGPPVQLIEYPSEGFACTASDNCSYAVNDLATMERHGRKKHGHTSMIDLRYRACLVQQLFPVLRKSYFEVGYDVMPGARPDIKPTIEATLLPAVDVALLVTEAKEREFTPLTRFMGWDTFKLQLRKVPTQKQAADDIKKDHKDDELGGILAHLSMTVRHHMSRASTILDDHPHRLSLYKLLLYGNTIPRDT